VRDLPLPGVLRIDPLGVHQPVTIPACNCV